MSENEIDEMDRLHAEDCVRTLTAGEKERCKELERMFEDDQEDLMAAD